MERLVIKNFAGFKSLDFVPRQITVLIGPQASGKSVLAKLTYFFRSMWAMTLSPFGGNSGDLAERTEQIKSTFRRYFPPEAWGSQVFSMQYEVSGHKFTIRRSPSKGRPSDGLIVKLPKIIETLSLRQLAVVDNEKGKPSKRPMPRYRRLGNAWRDTQVELERKIKRDYFSDQLFIPAARAFFSNVEDNVFSFIARSEKMLDPFIARFGEFYSYVKMDAQHGEGAKSHVTFIEKMLGGELRAEKDSEFLECSDGRRIPVGNLSSGQQELLPLLMGLGAQDYFLESPVRNALYIEEPEAHLFPEYQRTVLDYIVSRVNDTGQFTSLLLTTHSPYVLSQLNNLIFAHQLGSNSSCKDCAKAVESIVPRALWVGAGAVGAYALGDGTCKSIIDDETKLVNASYIDNVSTDIGHTFDKLLEVSYELSR